MSQPLRYKPWLIIRTDVQVTNYHYIEQMATSQVPGQSYHDLLGYEKADLTVHPPPRTAEGRFFFRIGV